MKNCLIINNLAPHFPIALKVGNLVRHETTETKKFLKIHFWSNLIWSTEGQSEKVPSVFDCHYRISAAVVSKWSKTREKKQ